MKISFYDPEEQTPRNSEDQFTLDWPSELGWKKNPFELERQIAGVQKEKQEINLFFIKKRQFGSIQAESGNGKTTLLTWLAEVLSKDFQVIFVQENTHASAPALRSEIADALRGVFSKGKDISDEELKKLLEKKSRKQPLAILIDDVDDHEAAHAQTIQMLTEQRNVHVLVSCHRLPSPYNITDQLALDIPQRNQEQYTQILKQRIEAVEGRDTMPFTQEIISELTKQSSNTQEFLQHAHEAAIHLALNDGVFDNKEKPKKQKKNSVKKKDRTKYDDLIESLGEELTQ